MKVLVVGGGGREHAIAWKINKSSKVDKIFAAPGNAGIAKIAKCIDIKPDDIYGLKNFALKNKIDLTIVGPELPLTMGIWDEFKKEGLTLFGPSKSASLLEGSKAYAKKIMAKYKIPTADFEIFDDYIKAKDYIKYRSLPMVIKADGLAAGKGVFVSNSREDALFALDNIMKKKVFGDAGKKVVIEDCLVGEEASFLAFSDGKNILPMASSQDHKPIYDDDKGPNTGGMGAYSPAPIVSDEVHKKIMKRIMFPLVSGLNDEGIKYVGVIYAGLMIKDNDPYVLEFNVRFGDPETQPILMRMKSDLLEIIEASITGNLLNHSIQWDKRPSVCVVLASSGYPNKYEKGFPISGLEDVEKIEDVQVFHAGTTIKDGKIITNGGRVLGITSIGENIPIAISKAYEAVKMISWQGIYYRKDIGKKALFRCRQ
ncbi:MAG: phosphoribosylamine--glycine ligase [Deltaproteobacteria bacterium]|nr:phosphoribosylamine--glycine ligase [Deltaproteobacteria bacterium]